MTGGGMRGRIGGRRHVSSLPPSKQQPRHDHDQNDLENETEDGRKTGHPTEAELIKELQFAVDLFRPSFDEEQGHDMANNCRRLWPLIYGREMDPRAEIIAPALAIRKAGYGEPTRDYKQELRDALKSAT